MKKSTNNTQSSLRSKLENNPQIKLSIDGILGFLPNCEYELILYMSKKGLWAGMLPPPPPHFKTGDGAVELGLFLYWFHNHDLLDLSMFTPQRQREIKDFIIALNFFLQKTKFNAINYTILKSGDLIYIDGSILNMEMYATFDQGWFVAFLNLLQTTLDFAWYNNGSFPTVPPPVIPLVGKNTNTVNIAIIGDWGAGNANAKAVMAMVKKEQPDYIIHVGDTYYSGTPLATDPSGNLYYAPGEEIDNLLNGWPSDYQGKSFTLNSNHEMYSGANGLFYNAYGANQTPIGAQTPFSAHQGSSCFALKFGDYTLLGLDSAYESKVENAFMTGSLGAPNGTQANWIKSLKLNPNKTIILSHHNGFEDNTNSGSPLWAELQNALGGDPFAWYWGHVHNGIVYKKPITIPSTPTVPGFTTNTFARCLGHASLPYGVASSLVGKQIDYKADNLKPNSNELYNGFAMLSLTTRNGVIENISEGFYDVSGSPSQPRYFRRLL
ncbi:metallophosphoesterase [Mariniflexile litorale]|uniref:Metallophosphoesterase n=1 Tax=Mariniflexile litorale TaxID=3045158 RepID=A0AAU7EG38_9FLAO|nr:metallophosphoesterase [Mariniflexile sp. KMM 9835]MDQ8212314.1 metallophosphoesterase [Mariniflexile sp. KMM 9835]